MRTRSSRTVYATVFAELPVVLLQSIATMLLEWAYEEVQAARGWPEPALALLDGRPVEMGTLLRLRMVCRQWYDSVPYSLITGMLLGSIAPKASAKPPPKRLVRFPLDFAVQFSGCEQLVLYYARLESLPESVRGMRSLQDLSIGIDCCLVELPAWVESQPLVSLSVSHYLSRDRRFDEDQRRRSIAASLKFSEWLGSPTAMLPTTLETLKLQEVAPSAFPTCIRSLRKLTTLHITEGWFRANDADDPADSAEPVFAQWEAPPWLGELRALTCLTLPCSSFSTAAAGLSQLSLEVLDLYCGDVGTPCQHNHASFSQLLAPSSPILSSLEVLRFRSHDMTELPPTIRFAKHMSCLEARCKHLVALPDWISELPLAELVLADCFQLNSLPVSLRTMTTLRKLDLANTDLHLADVVELRETAQERADGRQMLQRMQTHLLPLAVLPDLEIEIFDGVELPEGWIALPDQAGWADGWWTPNLLPDVLDDANWLQ